MGSRLATFESERRTMLLFRLSLVLMVLCLVSSVQSLTNPMLGGDDLSLGPAVDPDFVPPTMEVSVAPTATSDGTVITEVGNGDGTTTTTKAEATTTSSANALVMHLLVTMTTMMILVVIF